MLQYTLATNETEHECFLPSNPLYVAHGPPLICSKGSPTGGDVGKGKNGKVLRLVQLPVQCTIPNPDGRGQRH